MLEASLQPVAREGYTSSLWLICPDSVFYHWWVIPFELRSSSFLRVKSYTVELTDGRIQKGSGAR